jgi:uncharacterized protein
MGGRRVSRILCAAEPRGSAGAVEQLLGACRDADAQAVAIVGDIGGGDDRTASYRAVLHALGRDGRPAFWLPGAGDAPLGALLREAYNMEVVHPSLHGVHGTAAFADEHVVVAGLGGQVSDEPDAPRDEQQTVRYPRWEAEYRLRILREMPEHQLALMFWTPPAHKGRGEAGSEALAELVNTYRPRVVVCGGERGSETLGRTLVVAPGALRDGHYAIAHVHDRTAELASFAAAASSV